MPPRSAQYSEYTLNRRTRRKATTNALCPHRGRCLAEVFNANPAFIDCTGCQHVNSTVDDQILFADLDGALRLLWAVFVDAHRAERMPVEIVLAAVLGPGCGDECRVADPAEP